VASNRDYLGQVYQISGKRVYIQVKQALEGKKSARMIIGSVLFALGKGKKNDLVVEKVTEIGLDRIIIWKATRSIPEAENCEARIARWKKIAESASRQSGKSHVPEIGFADNQEELLRLVSALRDKHDLSFCCSLSPDAMPLRELRHFPLQGKVYVAVGPEGGFTTQEEELFTQNGFELASLSTHVLRSETAAIVACGAVQALWGDF
jgi:16S rRNA (uracil1498-N3)-methyltransferase